MARRRRGRKWRVLVLHGPNLNLLGSRETSIYGKVTLEAIDLFLNTTAARYEAKSESRQTNHEGVYVDWLHQAPEQYDGCVVNPAAFSHTSIAIRDAIAAIEIPCVEVHLSNIHAREDFRQRSLVAPVCIGTISGFGPQSYTLGLRGLLDYLTSRDSEETHTD